MLLYQKKQGTTGIQSTVKHKPQGNQKFRPLPAPTGKAPYRIGLEDVISPNDVQKIKSQRTIQILSV